VTLIHHPGSACQLTTITIDAGHARDIMLMLTDARAVTGDLAGGAAPRRRPAGRRRLREASSPYTPAGLAGAPGEVVTWLHHARRDALAHVTPPPAANRPGHRTPPRPGFLFISPPVRNEKKREARRLTPEGTRHDDQPAPRQR
jgi:hypothetical protein